MRYYEIHLPDHTEPLLSTNVRALHDLPDGTRIEAIITDRDGSLIETYEVPVRDGRAVIERKGKHRARLSW